MFPAVKCTKRLQLPELHSLLPSREIMLYFLLGLTAEMIMMTVMDDTVKMNQDFIGNIGKKHLLALTCLSVRPYADKRVPTTISGKWFLNMSFLTELSPLSACPSRLWASTSLSCAKTYPCLQLGWRVWKKNIKILRYKTQNRASMWTQTFACSSVYEHTIIQQYNSKVLVKYQLKIQCGISYRWKHGHVEIGWWLTPSDTDTNYIFRTYINIHNYIKSIGSRFPVNDKSVHRNTFCQGNVRWTLSLSLQITVC